MKVVDAFHESAVLDGDVKGKADIECFLIPSGCQSIDIHAAAVIREHVARFDAERAACQLHNAPEEAEHL